MRSVLRILSPGGSRGRLTILNFHRVHAERDPIFPQEMHAAAFRERLGWVQAWFNVLPLAEAVTALARGRLPERALALTFDDGYADNVAVALPVLQEMGMHATFFIAAAYIDGGRMWNDTVIEAVRGAPGTQLDLSALELGRHAIDTPMARREVIESLLARLKYLSVAQRGALADAVAAASGIPLPGNLMMSSAELRVLAASGMGIGAHTMSHPILARIDEAASYREIAEGREVLERILLQPVTLFAYPNGKPDVDYRRAHVRMMKTLGFAGAVTTSPGAARNGDGLYELPRFAPWDRTPLRFGARLARNLLVHAESASV